ncbi:hypothetical protein MTR_7g023960 [Medicago truncatula]|uniref:Uncharacterized protein n=1 Tax=Medicago truncatula TaxID=3880 RepID=G7KWR2_MEDTR|nr:hypothetical protein MTR_7g023960 [Medicago truncatula]
MFAAELKGLSVRNWLELVLQQVMVVILQNSARVLAAGMVAAALEDRCGGDKEGKLEEEREKAVLHREIERVRKPWKIHAGMEKKECCSGKEIVPRRRGKHGVL